MTDSSRWKASGEPAAPRTEPRSRSPSGARSGRTSSGVLRERGEAAAEAGRGPALRDPRLDPRGPDPLSSSLSIGRPDSGRPFLRSLVADAARTSRNALIRGLREARSPAVQSRNAGSSPSRPVLARDLADQLSAPAERHGPHRPSLPARVVALVELRVFQADAPAAALRGARRSTAPPSTPHASRSRGDARLAGVGSGEGARIEERLAERPPNSRNGADRRGRRREPEPEREIGVCVRRPPARCRPTAARSRGRTRAGFPVAAPVDRDPGTRTRVSPRPRTLARRADSSVPERMARRVRAAPGLRTFATVASRKASAGVSGTAVRSSGVSSWRRRPAAPPGCSVADREREVTAPATTARTTSLTRAAPRRSARRPRSFARPRPLLAAVEHAAPLTEPERRPEPGAGGPPTPSHHPTKVPTRAA
jgi:hypothetical protein